MGGQSNERHGRVDESTEGSDVWRKIKTGLIIVGVAVTPLVITIPFIALYCIVRLGRIPRDLGDIFEVFDRFICEGDEEDVK